MSLREAIAAIGRDYPAARTEPFAGHPTLGLVRRDAPAAVRAALSGFERRTYVRGSAGPSRWATIPWVAVFDGHVTRSARRGFYAVYLWSADGARAYLSLIVGTQDVRKAYGAQARDVLRDRAWALRREAAALGHELPRGGVDPGADKELAGDYEAGHAAGWAYDCAGLPSEGALADHLRAVTAALFDVSDRRLATL